MSTASTGCDWTKLGGSSVCVDDSGEIEKGCPGLKGENIDALHQNPQERAQRQEAAEDAGWESQATKAARESWRQSKESPVASENDVVLVRSQGRYFAFDEDAEVLRYVAGVGDGSKAEIDAEDLQHHLQQLVRSGYRGHVAEASDPDPHDVTHTEDPSLEGDHEDIDLDDSFNVEDFETSDGGNAVDQVPGQIGDAMRSLMERPEAQRGQVVEADNFHEDYAQSLYEELQSQLQKPDDHGEVHDLSEELGHGAIGYYSPHGVLAIKPPTFEGDGWDVKFAHSAGQMQSRTVEPEGEQEAVNAPLAQSSIDPDVEDAARHDLGMSRPEDIQEFQSLVNDLHKQRQDWVDEWNSARRELMAHFRKGHERGGLVRKVRSAADADAVQGFDEFVQMAENNYPILFHSASERHDKEAMLKDVIGGKFKPDADMNDSISEAIAYVDRAGGMSTHQVDEAGLMEALGLNDPQHYRRQRMLAKKYAKDLGISTGGQWKEDEHPRDQVGRFTVKHSSGSKHKHIDDYYAFKGMDAPYYLTGSAIDEVEKEQEGKHGALYSQIGLLMTPANYRSHLKRVDNYEVHAMDNGVFSGTFDPDKFEEMLQDVADEMQPGGGTLFAVAPDVFDRNTMRGDAKATIELSKQWFDKIHDYGFPAAMVAQDGLEDIINDIPWDQFEVLFIGGSDEFKLGQYQGEQREKWEQLIDEARKRGKRIHVGRVNSSKRIETVEEWADSVDGNYVKFGPSTNAPKMMEWQEKARRREIARDQQGTQRKLFRKQHQTKILIKKLSDPDVRVRKYAAKQLGFDFDILEDMPSTPKAPSTPPPQTRGSSKNLFTDYDGPKEGHTKMNQAGHQVVLHQGRWHLADDTGQPRPIDELERHHESELIAGGQGERFDLPQDIGLGVEVHHPESGEHGTVIGEGRLGWVVDYGHREDEHESHELEIVGGKIQEQKEEPKPEPKVYRDVEDYMAQHGASRQDVGDAGLHRGSETQSQRAKDAAIKAQSDRDAKWLVKREQLRQEYKEKLAAGEIREMTGNEKRIQTAQGHPDNESTQAARRLLEKRGIDWQTGEPIEQPGEVDPADAPQPPESESSNAAMTAELAREHGRQAGAQAHQDERVATPALDPAVQDFLGQHAGEVGNPITTSFLEGWNEAWHEKNTEHVQDLIGQRVQPDASDPGEDTAPEPGDEDTLPGEDQQHEEEQKEFGGDVPSPKKHQATLPGNSSRPRASAAAHDRALDENYDFARKSAVPNIGEDLLGSARHKANEWQDTVANAIKEGNAEKLLTRTNLKKNSPLTLHESVGQETMMAHLGLKYAMDAFPPKATGSKYFKYAKDDEKEMAYTSYAESWEILKNKAHEIAADPVLSQDPVRAVGQFHLAVSQRLKDLRETNRYDRHANDLAVYSNKIKPYDRVVHNSKSSPMGKLREFKQHFDGAVRVSDYMQKEDFTTPTADNALTAAQGILEGQSFGKATGTSKPREQSEVTRFNVKQLYRAEFNRKGGEQVEGNVNQLGDRLLDEYGFRGVQFGNYVPDEERQHHLKRCVEAFADLADIMGVDPKHITQDGQLGLAIGARGNGTALAHYEPDTDVINLTRSSGIGALAHEWGHFFDRKIGVGNGGFLSQHRSPQRHVRNNDVADPRSKEAYTLQDYSDDPVWQAMDGVRKAWKASGFESRMRTAVGDAVREGQISKNKRSYWTSDEEVFARTFEKWCQFKLQSQGRSNTYLSSISPHGFWPTHEEAAAMAPAFEKLAQAYRMKATGNPQPTRMSKKDRTNWVDRAVKAAENE